MESWEVKQAVIENSIARSEFEAKLDQSIKDLFALVDDCCFNIISTNYSIILTEIELHPKGNVHDQMLKAIQQNQAKSPMTFDEVVTRLHGIHSNLYDIVCIVFKAEKNQTILEVSYVLKSALDQAHRETVIDVEPMFHSRIVRPFHMGGRNEKFDINWQHQKWKNWWRRISIRRH